MMGVVVLNRALESDLYFPDHRMLLGQREQTVKSGQMKFLKVAQKVVE